MIETDNLILRRYGLEDYEPYCAMVCDPNAPSFPSRQLISREEAWHRLMRYTGHWSLLGYGVFAVIEKVTGQYIGETGLADFHREMGENFDGFDEAAWYIAHTSHRRGYGFEAARAAHSWYLDRRGARRTVCMIDPDNAPSIGLATKLGYHVYREGTYRDHPVVMFERVVR